MLREFDMNYLKGVRDGMFLYEYNGTNETIDIKKSAEIWWEKHHKSTIKDIILKKRVKNKYAGDKCFNFTEPYIRLYAGGDEVIFKNKFPEEVDTSDVCEFRMWWDDINAKINQLGYWLFDEG